MTRKPKIGNLTNTTELYPFLESKKVWIFWSRDFSVKPINTLPQSILVPVAK